MIGRGLRHEAKAWKLALLSGSLVITIVVIARLLGLLQSLEWMALDSLMQHRPAERMDDRIVVITIDDQDIEQLKAYPVPDQELAAVITKLQTYKPAAIGIDLFRDLPIEPGHEALLKAFQTYPNLFIIEQLPFGGNAAIQPPKGVDASQVAFANSMPLDSDGHPRRHLLGATEPRFINTPEAADHYKYSFATQLATTFLIAQGFRDEAGQNDPETLRFGAIELPRIRSNTGAYVNADATGTQVLLNYRSGSEPFRVLPLRAIRQNQFSPDWMRGKVILIGTSAVGVKDFANVAAISTPDPTYPGVKVHAHAVSQILAGVLDHRPFLRAWIDLAEYLWIVLWGILGIGIGRRLQAPWQILPAVAIVTLGLIGICYVALLAGWWIPLVPALMAFLLNGAGLSSGLLYRAKQELETQDAIRQAALEQVFNSIHNRPLQRLSTIVKRLKDQSNPPFGLIQHLEDVDQDLRSLRQEIARIAYKQGEQIQLGHEWFDLQLPLHELLQVVCNVTLQRVDDFPSLQKVKLQLIDIPSKPEQMISDRALTLAQKDGLCRFLEEAICNVGKHGIDVSQIQIFCGKEHQYQVIRVIDNGANQVFPEPTKAQNRISGSVAAKKLAKQLGGKFDRFANQPHGTICELRWKARSQRI